MTVIHAWRLARRYLPLLLLATLAGLALGWAWHARTTTYVSSSHVLIRPAGDIPKLGYASEPMRFVKSEGQRALSDAVIRKAALTLQPVPSLQELRDSLEVLGGSADDTVELRVTTDDADLTTNRARALTLAFAESSRSALTVTPLYVTPAKASSGRTTSLAAGGLVGLAAGVVGALVLGSARRPVLGPDALQLSGRTVDTYPTVLTGNDPEGYERLLGRLHQTAHRPQHLVVQLRGADRRADADTKVMATGLQRAAALVESTCTIQVSPASTPALVEQRPDRAVITVVCADRRRSTERGIEAAVTGWATGSDAAAIVVHDLGRGSHR